MARAYLEAGGQVARDRVSWLITLGVPHKGMLKTFQAVYSGIKAFTFSAAQTKSTSRGYPSAYELLPTDPADGLFRSAQPGQSPFDDPSWCETATMRTFLAAAGTTVSDLLPGTLPVDSCLIYGTRRRTTASCQDAGGGTLGFTELADGDGTVPRVSAMGQGLTGAGRLLRFPCLLGAHTLLFDDRFVQQEILTPILLRRPLPDRFLFAHFEREPTFVPRSDNLFVAEVLDQDGRAISGATVTLTLQGTTIRDRVVPEDAERHDYVLRVRMPGPGVSTRYQVTARVPGDTEPVAHRRPTGLDPLLKGRGDPRQRPRLPLHHANPVRQLGRT